MYKIIAYFVQNRVGLIYVARVSFKIKKNEAVIFVTIAEILWFMFFQAYG